MIKSQLNLKGFDFQELLTSQGLMKLDRQFLTFLQEVNPQWHSKLLAIRHHECKKNSIPVSQLLIDCAIVLEKFLADLFDIEEEVAKLQVETLSHEPIFAFRTYYVMKQARRVPIKRAETLEFFKLNQIIIEEISSNRLDNEDLQLAIAQLGLLYLRDQAHCQLKISQLIDWCAAALYTVEGQQYVQHWEMFKVAKHLDYANLVTVQPLTDDPFGRLQGTEHRFRDGFELTDLRMTQRQAMWEIDYCVYCHKNQGDFCSRGFPVKKNDEKQGLKINTSGELLTGCPLEEKISEMHVLKKSGYGLAALAMIMIDNPMCPMTGHRICNDCMKACIYQKQDPVDIPQTETRILTDVLALPWGVEIYDLLTRWHPLRQSQWVAKPYNGLKVLVMGMGPAGFTLAHHLLMEGFAVAGMDGLKIEPLSSFFLQPIRHYSDITENLADRVVTGFGGVAEYGITVRWDKIFLKVVYLSLLRRPYFQVIGSIRFGGSLTVEDVWRLGFDHLSLAVGAGLPKELAIPNSLAPGMRQANDFLMALQLTGAAKATSLANLQVRLPAVVIGGGLTAVDTATEVQAYYLVQIEKIAKRYQTLVAHYRLDTVRSSFLPADLTILDEFLAHADQLAKEREESAKLGRKPRLTELIHQWGGVTIAYRKTMQESPAYRRNHEELIKAFEEGIYYAEGLEPRSVVVDADGQVQALNCQWSVFDENGEWIVTDERQALPARSIFVATGAKLNVAYEFEHRGTFLRQDRFEYRRYERVHAHLQHVDLLDHVKAEHFGAFTSYSKDHRLVSFLGDTHPVFHGSVVKAIASAKRVYPEITKALAAFITKGNEAEYQQFKNNIDQLFDASVVDMIRHNHQVIELVVRAPAAAQSFGPGQFYRVQNYESNAEKMAETSLAMEGLALLGVPHQQPELLSFFVIEKGASSKLVQKMRVGERISVMGPTGAASSKRLSPAHILIIGDVYSPAFLFSMCEKFREEGHHIFYLGYFENPDELYCQVRVEAIAEQIIWVTQSGKIHAHRPQDLSFTQLDLVDALQQFPELAQIDQVYVIGSACLLAAIKSAQESVLKQIWPKGIPVIGSVYGPMQCMLKGVCAQCLQWQVDPMTGQRSKAVYACSWQHQPLEKIDISHIDERLSQNRCQETLTNLWLDHLMESVSCHNH